MSTRVSATTKQIINSHYSKMIKALESEINNEKDKLTKVIFDSIKDSQEFKDVVESFNKFRNYVDEQYPNVILYSRFRESLNEDTTIGYTDSNNKPTNDYIKERQAKINELNREKNMLLFRLENAPIKSKEYEETYKKLQDMLNENQN